MYEKELESCERVIRMAIDKWPFGIKGYDKDDMAQILRLYLWESVIPWYIKKGDGRGLQGLAYRACVNRLKSLNIYTKENKTNTLTSAIWLNYPVEEPEKDFHRELSDRQRQLVHSVSSQFKGLQKLVWDEIFKIRGKNRMEQLSAKLGLSLKQLDNAWTRCLVALKKRWKKELPADFRKNTNRRKIPWKQYLKLGRTRMAKNRQALKCSTTVAYSDPSEATQQPQDESS